MSGTDHLFRAFTRHAGTPEAAKGHSVTCTVAGCEAELFIPAGGVRGPGGLPTDVVLKKAQQAGWLIRRKGRSRTCPDCQKPAPAPSPVVKVTREAHRALHAAGRDTRPRIVVPLDPAVPVHMVPADEPTHQAAAAAQIEEGPPMGDVVKLDQPRQLTLDEKRAVNAKLHEVHDGDGYAGDWTDRKVAELLDVPAAAVAAIRADFFGPDVNEEQRRAEAARAEELAARAREVAAIRQQLDAVRAKVDAAMETLASADSQYRDALSRLAQLEGRN